MEEKIKQAIFEQIETKDGKKYLSCSAAFQIAAENNSKPATIGKICNAENIKLTKCQLGCF